MKIIKSIFLISIFISNINISYAFGIDFTDGYVNNEDSKLYKFAAGDKLALYYTTADKICYVQDQVHQKNICEVLKSNGSLENLQYVKSGKAEFGIVQLDHLVQEMEANPSSNIRSVLQLYPESLTIIVKRNSNIWNTKGLENKNILTTPYSGANLVIKLLLQESGINSDNIKFTDNIPSSVIAKNICNSKFDGAAFMISHPNALVHEIAKECEIRILPISDSMINKITSKYPQYHKDVILENIYPGIIMPIFTISTHAHIITRISDNNKLVFDFIKNIVNNLKYLRNTYDAMNEINEETIVPDEKLVKLHKSSKRFFSNFLNR